MTPLRAVPLALILALAATSACSSGGAVARFSEAVTADSVRAYVEARGFNVTNHYQATPSPELQALADLEVVEFFALRGRLNIYTFRSVEAAEQSVPIRDFGSVCRTRQGAISIQSRFDPTAVCTPVPVFQEGAVVAVYLGDEAGLEPVLRDAFGPPFRP